MNLVILGAPGAGKDTLANSLSSKKYEILSPGELYRKEKAAGTKFGLEAYSYWGNGNLCPDDMTNELMRRVTAELDYMGNIRTLIFNGYPRSKNQAEYLDSISHISTAINIRVDEDVAVERLLKRGRIDDTADTIKTRIKVYHKNNEDVLDHYRDGRLIEVNGNLTPKEVTHLAITLLNRSDL